MQAHHPPSNMQEPVPDPTIVHAMPRPSSKASAKKGIHPSHMSLNMTGTSMTTFGSSASAYALPNAYSSGSLAFLAGSRTNLSEDTKRSAIDGAMGVLPLGFRRGRRGSRAVSARLSVSSDRQGVGSVGGLDSFDLKNSGKKEDQLEMGLDESVKTIAATALPEYEPPQTDITQLDPYLAAISRADFQLGAFMTEFLFHLAFTVCPLLALLPVKQLRIMAKNRSFLPGVTTLVFIMQSCLALSVILVNVLVLGFDCRLFTSLQLGIFNATVLLRLIVIAAKYSYMSPLEYTETLTSTETSAESASRRQVLTGWSRPTRSLREIQLLLASIRQQCSLTFAKFEIGPIDPHFIKSVSLEVFAPPEEFKTVIVAASNIAVDQEVALESDDIHVPTPRTARSTSAVPARDAILAIHTEMQDRYASFQPQDFIAPNGGSIVIPSTSTAVAIAGGHEPSFHVGRRQTIAQLFDKTPDKPEDHPFAAPPTWTVASTDGSATSPTFSNFSGGLKPVGTLPPVLSASNIIPSEDPQDDAKSTVDDKFEYKPPPVARSRAGSFHHQRPASASAVHAKRLDDIGSSRVSVAVPVKPPVKYSLVNQVKFVTVWEVAEGVIDESMGLEVHLGWMWVPGLLHTMVPFMSLWMDASAGRVPPYSEWTTQDIIINTLIYFFATYLSFTVMFLHFGFLIVGITDFRRREYFQRRLAAIIEDGFVHVSLSKDTEDPQYVIHRIPMDRPQNVIAWWYLRACLQDWGLTYFRRISLYAGFFLVYVFILIAVAFVQMYFVERALETSVILYVTLHGAVLCGLLSIMIFFGERYNQNRRRAGLCLSQKKVELESEYSDITRRLRILSHHPQKPSMETMETRRAQLYDAVRSIETVMQTVQNDNGMNCIKILGFEAGDQLLQGVLTVAGFGVTAVLRRFL